MPVVGRLLGFILVVLSMVAMVACGGGGSEPSPAAGGDSTDAGQADRVSPEDLEQLAKQEGKVTWYTVTPAESAARVAEVFTAKTGIQVEVFSQIAGPLTETLYAEAARGTMQVDVVTHSEASTMVRLGDDGVIAAYESPEAVHFPADAVELLRGYAYPDRVTLMTVTYNEDLVSGADLEFLKADPLEAVVDPRFKGKIALPDPNVTGSTFAYLYLVGLTKGGWDSPEAIEWYRALAANEPMILGSNAPAADAVVGGEVEVALIVESFVAPQVQKGAPVGILYPEPALATFGVTGVTAKAPHPNAARYFLNWFLSKEGQETWNREYNTYVTHREVEDQRTYLVEKSWYNPPGDLFFATDLQAQDDARTPFLDQFNDIFGI